MKRLILVAIFALLPFVAFADTYDVAVSWVDSTTYNAGETPTYNVETRCNPVAAGSPCDSTVSTVTGLTSPSYSTVVNASPTDTIEARVQNENGGLVSNWSVWTVATAPAGPTQPNDPTSVIITITRQ